MKLNRDKYKILKIGTRNIFICICLFIFIISCSQNSHINENKIKGLYGYCDKGYSACTQLLLGENNNFQYYMFYDVGGGHILEGNWQIDTDTLIINTFNQPKYEKGYKIIDKELREKTTLKFYNTNKKFPLSYAKVKLNKDSKYILLDSNGTVGINNIHLQIVNINYLGFNDSLNLKISEKYSEIEFYFDIPLSSVPEYLKNEKWLIRKNKIIPFLRSENKYDENYYLRKTNIENKEF